MTVTKTLFLIAILGHVLCAWCDCLLIYAGGKKFSFSLMADNDGMQRVFSEMPARNPLMSMLLGCLALLLCSGGYYALYLWMKPFSETAALIMLIAGALFFIPGTAHHVFCGVMEWFYIRMNMTEQARQVVADFFKKTSVTMIACYIGMMTFCVTLFVMVVSGATALPAWACVFNSLLIAAVLFPMRIGGAGNWAGAIMFLALLLLI